MVEEHQEKSHTTTRFSFISQLGCIVVSFLSILVIVGWEFHVELLKRILPMVPPMNPIEAILLILTSTALFLRINQKELSLLRLLSINFFISVVFLGGVVTLLELILHLPFRIDALLFPENVGNSLMAPNTAISFVLLSFALFVYHKNHTRFFGLTQFFALCTGIIAMFAGVGYIYNVLSFYRIDAIFAPMSLSTASAFAVLVISTLFSTHHYGMMKVLTDDLVVSSLSRKLIIAAVAIPVGLGIVRIFFQNWMNMQEGTAFFVVTQILVSTLLIWITTKLLYKDELEKMRMTESLKKKTLELEEASQQLAANVSELHQANKKISDLLSHQQNLQDIMGSS